MILNNFYSWLYMGKSYVGDIGTRIRLTLDADLAGYTDIDFKIKKPDGTELDVDCTVEDETNGIIYYDVVDGDFDVAGTYLIQAEITFSDGDYLLSETKSFTVYDAYAWY